MRFVLPVQARPIEDGLAEAIDEGRVGPRDDPKIRSKILAEEFGWDKDLAKKIWCARSCALHAPLYWQTLCLCSIRAKFLSACVYIAAHLIL